MRIDRRLNLVVPIFGDPVESPGADGNPSVVEPIIAYVHSTPLSAEAVDHYFGTLGPVFNQVMTGGFGIAAGPANALRILRRVADNSGSWTNRDGSPGEAQTLVEEIRRLTMVAIPAERGWTAVPLDVAVAQGHLNAEDKAEVENAIVFFIAASATLGRAARREMIEMAAGLWGARTSSLNSTEFTASLKTSIGTGNTGEKSPAPALDAPATATATVDGKPVSIPV